MAASTSTTTAPNGTTAAANGTAEKKASKSKNALRRQKAKAKKAQGDRESSVATTGYATETDAETDHEGQTALGTPSASMEDLTIDTSDPAYAQFAAIMDKFQGTDTEAEEKKVSILASSSFHLLTVGILGRRTERCRDHLLRRRRRR